MPEGPSILILREQTESFVGRIIRAAQGITLRKHWLAHNKTICPRDHVKFTRAHLGVRRRRSFYCELCQRLYA